MKRFIEVVSLAAAFTALVIGVCWLPYKFPPPSQFIGGASFDAGFNNGVAYLWYIVFLWIPAILLARFLDHTPNKKAPSAFEPLGIDFSPWVSAVLVTHILLFAAVYAYKGWFPAAEGIYFQTLTQRMTFGEIPYMDFSYYYGPAMIYPGYWLGKVVSLEAGYGLWFVVNYELGLLLLYAVLRSFLGSARETSFWFVLLALGLLNPWTSVNVTLVRYVLPSAVFFLLVEYFGMGGRGRFAKTLALFALALTYSFDTAALCVVAALLLIPIMARSSGLRIVVMRCAGLLAAGGALCAAAFYAIDPTGKALRMYPEIALSYAAGAHNVPLLPSPPFLTLAAITVFAAGATVLMLVREKASGASLIAAGYLLLALMAQRASFGASDAAHFVHFGLPVFLLAIFMAHRHPTKKIAVRCILAGILIGILVPYQAYNVSQVLPFFYRPKTAGAGVSPAASLSGKQIAALLDEFVGKVGAARPYVMYNLEYYSFPTYRKFNLRYPMYFTNSITARDEAGMERYIQDVRKAKAIVLILRKDLDAVHADAAPAGGAWKYLALLTGSQTPGSKIQLQIRANESRLNAGFIAFLKTEYHPLYERDGLVAFGPRSDAPLL